MKGGYRVSITGRVGRLEVGREDGVREFGVGFSDVRTGG
jgi:hypothetical protein